MRIVVDTNVFVSLLIRPGDTFSALIDYIDRHATVLYSTDTLTEVVDVLRRPKFRKYTDAAEVAELVRWVVAAGEMVTVQDSVVGSRDRKDDMFLALAVSGSADYLISGDQDLLALGRIGNTPILSPAGFLAAINR